MARVELASSSSSDTPNELNVPKAVVLGLVEGVTEFLPVSSTGHLLVVERAMGIGQTPETKDAADTYAVTIQAGAILAVVLLYHRRLRSMVEGVLGRDPAGRTVAIAVIIAFVPPRWGWSSNTRSVTTCSACGRSSSPGRWGGSCCSCSVIAATTRRSGTARPGDHHRAPGDLLVGAAQVLALWPGTSRSLVTIIAALAVGLSLSAAIEFSFLLGLLTWARRRRTRG